MWSDKKNRLVVRYLKTDTSDTGPSYSHYLSFGLLRLRGVNPLPRLRTCGERDTSVSVATVVVEAGAVAGPGIVALLSGCAGVPTSVGHGVSPPFNVRVHFSMYSVPIGTF